MELDKSTESKTRSVPYFMPFPPSDLWSYRQTLSLVRPISSAMQPFQLFSYSGSGNAATAEEASQLW